MTVALRIEGRVRVRFDECGADGAARASAYVRWAQDAAWRHSELAGFDRQWYADRRLTWLVRCLELELRTPVASSRELVVSTELTGFRRIWARRLGEVRDADDRTLLATVVTDWVLLGANGLPARVPAEIVAAFPADLPDFAPARVPPLLPPPGTPAPAFPARRHELDPLGHINHAVYLDWLEAAVAAAGGEAELVRCPRRYRLEYERPAMLGDALSGAAWRLPAGDWAYALEGATGRPLLRGRFGAG